MKKKILLILLTFNTIYAAGCPSLNKTTDNNKERIGMQLSLQQVNGAFEVVNDILKKYNNTQDTAKYFKKSNVQILLKTKFFSKMYGLKIKNPKSYKMVIENINFKNKNWCIVE